MLLVIDVGNTNMVLGVYKDTELLDHWRISTDRQRTTDEYGVLIRELFYLNDLRADDINAIIISSVVPMSCLRWKECVNVISVFHLCLSGRV